MFKKGNCSGPLVLQTKSAKSCESSRLKNLLQFIPPIHHAFYNAIKSDDPLKGDSNDVLFHPDLDCSDEVYIPD